MRSTTVFFILGLLVLARASEEANVFAQLDQHPFGSTLLDLVQINMQANAQTEMKTEDSINQISDLLNELQADSRANIKRANNDHKDFQDKADFDIAQYTKVVADQKARRHATKAQLKSDRASLKDAKVDLARAQGHLASLISQIAAADAANVKAKAAFQKKVKELRDAILATKQAVAELSKLNLQSFEQGVQLNMVEIQGGMKKVELALQQHLPARLAIFKPIITALIEMGTNADPALVKKVIGLINQLRNALEAELSTTIKQERVRAHDYKKLRADLVSDKVGTSARIGRDLALIKSLRSHIKSNEGILAVLNKSIPIAEKLLASRIAQKKAEQAAWVRDSAIRASELKVLEQLISFFQEKFAASWSNYLRNRAARSL